MLTVRFAAQKRTLRNAVRVYPRPRIHINDRAIPDRYAVMLTVRFAAQKRTLRQCCYGLSSTCIHIADRAISDRHAVMLMVRFAAQKRTLRNAPDLTLLRSQSDDRILHKPDRLINLSPRRKPP
jgi:hypothetical protein